MTKEQGTLFDDLPASVGQVSKHPAYRVWKGMIGRCCRPSNSDFIYYGLRGIYVCDEWRASSRAFVAWALVNGWQPGLQLDRRDNDGPYSPGNCRFVTRRDNQNNRRSTVRLSDGRAAWPVAQRNGVTSQSFHDRMRTGWSVDQAAMIPKGGKRPSATVRVALGESAASAQGDKAQRPAIPAGLVDLPHVDLPRPLPSPGSPAGSAKELKK